MASGTGVEPTGRTGVAETRTAGDRACPGVSDQALIQAFRQGDESAFDRLFTRHQDYVYNVCLGILGNADDARDCTQETFLRVYRKVAEFRAEAAFSTWLYRVTVNVCVGQLRKRSRVGMSSLEEETVREIADDGPELWVGPVREVDEQLVREVVAELPEDYRVLLVLRYFQDLSYEEMVEVMGYNLSQLKVKLHRARRAFARKWAARGETAVVLG
jgi:RNA polymerase sigma-70 factor (ECF subfamily)